MVSHDSRGIATTSTAAMFVESTAVSPSSKHLTAAGFVQLSASVSCSTDLVHTSISLLAWMTGAKEIVPCQVLVMLSTLVAPAMPVMFVIPAPLHTTKESQDGAICFTYTLNTAILNGHANAT